MIQHLDDLVAKAKARGKRRLIVAYGQDSHTLEAVNDAVEAGIVDATLVGNPEEIEKVCKAEGIDMSRFTIVAENVDVNCVRIAVQMVSEGKGDVLMKGLVSTDKYMRGILNKEFGLVPPKGVLSHVTVMEIPAYHKLPDHRRRGGHSLSGFRTENGHCQIYHTDRQEAGNRRPQGGLHRSERAALPGVQSSVEATLLAKMGERGQLGTKVYIDGPLALDVAINKEAAATKKLDNPVVGDADCLVFPNIDAGNVFFKSCTKFGGAELAAMVMGAKVPCVLTSRGDSKKTKMYSIALACLSAK